jgi:hypothetical protein
MVDLSRQRIPNQGLGDSSGTAVFEVSKCAAIAGILVAFLLTFAWIRDEILTVQYQIEALRISNGELRETNELLDVQYKALANPIAIEEAAKKLGLISSNDSQVMILEGDAAQPSRNQLAQSQNRPAVLNE